MPSFKRVRANSTYIFSPVPMDIYDARHAATPGQRVRVVNLHGCPPANTMGMCHIHSMTGEFLGLVCTNSLKSNVRVPSPEWMDIVMKGLSRVQGRGTSAAPIFDTQKIAAADADVITELVRLLVRHRMPVLQALAERTNDGIKWLHSMGYLYPTPNAAQPDLPFLCTCENQHLITGK